RVALHLQRAGGIPERHHQGEILRRLCSMERRLELVDLGDVRAGRAVHLCRCRDQSGGLDPADGHRCHHGSEEVSPLHVDLLPSRCSTNTGARGAPHPESSEIGEMTGGGRRGQWWKWLKTTTGALTTPPP